MMMILSLLFLLLANTITATTLSITPLKFTLQIDATSSTSWTTDDLSIFATAAQNYIDDHNLLSSALGLSSNSYEGINFFVSSYTDGRLRRLSDGIEVTLEGSVDIDSTALPTEEGLSEIVATLFQNGEALFVKQLIEEAENGGSDWLTKVTGYTVRVLDDDSSMQIAQAASSDDAQSQTSDNGINLYILIGAAGAFLSLLLLITGLCYAKRSHNSKDIMTSPPSKPTPTTNTSSILKNHSKSNTTSPSSLPQDPMEDSDDDESNADFLLARAQLNTPHPPIQPQRVSSTTSIISAGTSFIDDNMSYAFSVDGQSLVGSRMGSNNNGDVAIGAGGIMAFQNESGGVFRWNEDGTKVRRRVELPCYVILELASQYNCQLP
jgi:hypothetical protein